MLGPVVCRACGAKVREDRVKCLRCGAALAPAEPRAEAAGQRAPAAGQRSWRVMAASGTAVVLVGAAVVVWSGRPSQPAGPFGPAIAAAEPVASAATAASATGAPAPIAVSMDVSRAAIAAYVRGDIAGSIEQFSAAVAADPDNPDALNNLGQVLVRDGRAREAIPHFDRAIALVGTVWAYHFNRARAYGALKEWPPAVAGYREAARLFPDDYVTAFNLARALQENADLSGAIAEFERAIALAPGEPDFHLSHAYALERAQRPREAATAYRRYLDLQDGAPDAEKIHARISQLEGTAPDAASQQALR